MFSDQASAGSAVLLGVPALGGICTNICHFITSGTMLSNFQRPEQTELIIETLRIKQQWLDEDNRIQRAEEEEYKRKISYLERTTKFVDLSGSLILLLL